jgi:hypothetical protein
MAQVDALQRRALELLAGSMRGLPKPIMLMHGFTANRIAELVREGLATAKSEYVRAGGHAINVTRLRITDAGRRALTSS